MKGKFRILGRIGLAVFMVCALMVAFMPVAPVSAATAVTEVWVEFPAEDAAGANPGKYNVTGEEALYRIHFKATTALKRGVDQIVVQFPDGLDDTMGTVGSTYAFTLGGACNTETNFDVMVDPYAAAGKTYLDYHECTAAAYGGKRVTLTIGVDIAAGQDAWLLIDDLDTMVTGGVANTTAYKVKVNTSQDTTPVLSKGFYLGDSGDQVNPGNSGVTVSPSTAGSVGQYIFAWDQNSKGVLNANTDTITCTFPCGTTLPSSISASSVQVYDGASWSTCGLDPTVDTDLRTVRVTTPCDIATDTTTASVKFLSTAGIINPTYGNTGWGFTTRKEHVGFIRTTEAAQDVVCDDDGYTIDESSATTLDFDYTAAPRLVTGLSDKYTMINMYSSVLYLQVEDAYGNLCNTGSYISAQVTLSSTSGTGTFSIDSGSTSYTQITGTQTLSSGAKEIYYRDSTAGTHTLTASYTGLTSATWTFQVCPGASLYDRYDNLIHTYAPTTSAPAQETDVSQGGVIDWDVYKGGKYVDLATDAATTYDYIVLGDGHYEVDNTTNHLSFGNTYLTIKSLNGADYTTLDGSAKTSSGDHAADPTIYMTGSNVTIDGLTLSNNPTGTEGNRAIYLQGCNAFTIQNCKFVDCPCDNIILEATSAVTSGTITNNTFTGVGPRGHDGRYAIWLQSTSGNAVSGVSVTNNTFTNFTGLRGTAIGLVQLTGTMSNMTVQGNTISNCWRGMRIYGDTVGPTGLTDDYAIAENTITDCTIGLSVGGGTIETVFNFKNNTIDFTQYGIDIAPTALNTGTAISIQYNDITGTGDWGIYNHAGTVTVEPECKYNWWGDATGPSAGSGTYASTTARGSGEAISKDITSYEPWLHKPLADVVADNASYQAVEMKLIAGWNTLSTPVPLIAAADSVQELIPSGMTIGYYYDATGWHQITDTYVLSPCDAVYVKMSGITYVLLKFDAGAFTTPSKDLAVGWNLASLSYLGYTSTVAGQMNADDAAASVAKTPANLPGYAQVISPSINAGQTDIYGISGLSWAFAYGETLDDSTATQKMLAGLGYWIYMQNAATLAGFEITPIAPDLN